MKAMHANVTFYYKYQTVGGTEGDPFTVKHPGVFQMLLFGLKCRTNIAMHGVMLLMLLLWLKILYCNTVILYNDSNVLETCFIVLEAECAHTSALSQSLFLTLSVEVYFTVKCTNLAIHKSPAQL